MKKIVPFKKDIIFKTEVAEITSISLDNTLSAKEDGLVYGDFKVYGDYKVTDTSTSLESFTYELPFEIHMDEKYDLKNVTIEIDDFYYEIINNKVLTISIDVLLDNLEEKEVEKVNLDIKENSKEEKEEVEEKEKNRCIEEESPIIINNQTEEIYKKYKVYIVREGDTIESIMEKYKVTKEELEEYNDLSTLQINTKLIIQSQDETDS